ncbi:hypothetical protein C8A00DRAFT_43939 [Chaetomidium leptoderma]|uniref:DNA/RNA-binding domain-containing protein n=1 Tax=Chaetomidium leptoderma TaxID=669021 RepID=A0AAN6VKT8_9PEZI|nr:hypothetical protein C8A00DRAFT_43939 [Chaetomidium leptoderma]
MDDVSRKWVNHLRRDARKSKSEIRCPECNQGLALDFKKHFSDHHPHLPAQTATEKERETFIHTQWETAVDGAQTGPRRKPTGPAPPLAAPEDPTPSVKREGSRSPAATPAEEGSRDEFGRGSYLKKGTLYDPAAPPRPLPHDKSNVATPPQRQHPSSASLSKQHRQPQPPRTETPGPPPPADHSADFIKQPETRPISQEQLVAEVKGIYAGLVMVESKCIEVDNNQSLQNDSANKLTNDQWQALIALHRTLLHEHHDFFLASQHPSASPALRRLAAKYAMPARMWRHGIHSFLERLRHRLPDSLDHMLTFIYMAYSMIALLYETVPAFEDTWIECLGDLGRYRMAIEDDDIRDREVWTAVSRHWYSRASDKAPTTGRLYHHQAILARPNALQQLYYYSKSLCVDMPFLSARESIVTLFEPITSHASNPQKARLPAAELNFVKVHSILFSGKQQEELEATTAALFQLLDSHIGRLARRWLESGYHMGLANICAVIGYGDESNPVAAALKISSRPKPNTATTATTTDSHDQETTASETTSANTILAKNAATPPVKQLPNAIGLFTRTYDVACRRFADPNVLPFLHITLAFIYGVTFCPDAMVHLAPQFPWKLTAYMLNTLLNRSASSSTRNVSQASSLARLLESDRFPGLAQEGGDEGKEGKKEAGKDEKEAKKGNEKGAAAAAHARVRKKRPLPDDFAMRGFAWVERYFPDGWFVTEEMIDDDEKFFELPSMEEERTERVVWLGLRIAEREGGKWLRFDREAKRFGVNPDYEVDLDFEMSGQMPISPESVDYGELPDAGAVA